MHNLRFREEPLFKSPCSFLHAWSFQLPPNFSGGLLQYIWTYTEVGDVFWGTGVWWECPLLACSGGSVHLHVQHLSERPCHASLHTYAFQWMSITHTSAMGGFQREFRAHTLNWEGSERPRAQVFACIPPRTPVSLTPTYPNPPLDRLHDITPLLEAREGLHHCAQAAKVTYTCLLFKRLPFRVHSGSPHI